VQDRLREQNEPSKRIVEHGGRAMQTANDILKDKGRTVWSVKPTDTVLDA
jgi:hypothetical protein